MPTTTVGLYNYPIVSPGFGKDVSILVSSHPLAVGPEWLLKRPSSERLGQARAAWPRRSGGGSGFFFVFFTKNAGFWVAPAGR